MLNWADRLIEEYTVGRLELKRRADQLDRDNPDEADDLTIINGMIADMTFAIDWLKTGRQPDTFRGVEKKAIYQRKSFESLEFIPDITSQLDINDRELYISPGKKATLINILASFSSRERQCYIMHTTQDMSMSDIANELGVKKRTVQQYIERARKKVKENVG